MNTTDHTLDLTGWIARIRNCEMPVFGRTVDALHTLMEDEKASASALAQVILKDAAMTTKVLRLANSAFFNHAHQGISTVSRAIVVLGFDPVAELALSVSLVDSLLSGGVRSRVHEEMARSFHAAVQARWVAVKRGGGQGEEVFIAALLMRVGEMAFWCFGGEQARSLDRCMTQSGLKEDEAQQVVPGFPLRQLSVGLVREWRLGPLVAAALEGRPRASGPERAVVLGHKIARVAEQGWESLAGRQLLRELADYLEMAPSAVAQEIVANSAVAARIASTFGSTAAAGLIPQGNLPVQPAQEVAAPPSGPDPVLQLRILHDLAAMTVGRSDISEILQLAVEGVFRGVGCERVVLAMLTPDRRQLRGRLGLGIGAEALCARFVFSMDGEPDDVLDAAIDSAQACRIQPSRLELPGTERLIGVTGCDEAFLVPFGTPYRQIGVLYADRDGKPGDEERWLAIRHFAMQVSLAISLRGEG